MRGLDHRVQYIYWALIIFHLPPSLWCTVFSFHFKILFETAIQIVVFILLLGGDKMVSHVLQPSLPRHCSLQTRQASDTYAKERFYII